MSLNRHRHLCYCCLKAMRLSLFWPRTLLRLALLVSLPSLFMFVYIFTNMLHTDISASGQSLYPIVRTVSQSDIEHQLNPDSDYEMVTNSLSDMDYFDSKETDKKEVKVGDPPFHSSNASKTPITPETSHDDIEPFLNMPALDLPTDISLLPNKPSAAEMEKYLLQNYEINKAKGFSDFSLRVTEEMIEKGPLQLPELLPNLKVPCWVEEVPQDFTYKDNIYHCHINNRRIKQGFDRMFSSYQIRQHYAGLKWRLRCLPSFYLIGVAKCGTTDLFEALTRHPEVLKPDLKEPEYWPYLRFGLNDLILNMTCAQDKGLATYADYLDTYDLTSEMVKESIRRRDDGNFTASVLFGDYSTHTFIDIFDWDKTLDAPDRINAHHIYNIWPQSKFILILRDPVDRSYSRYKMRMARQNGGVKVKGSPEDFHSRVLKQVETTTNCLLAHPQRYCVYKAKYGMGQLGTNALLNTGMYAIYMKDWLSIIPLKQILIIKFEDYVQNRAQTIDRIIDFLGLGPLPKPYRDIIELMPVMNGGPSIGGIMDETRRSLQEFYRPFNQELVSLLGDERFTWGY